MCQQQSAEKQGDWETEFQPLMTLDKKEKSHANGNPFSLQLNQHMKTKDYVILKDRYSQF